MGGSFSVSKHLYYNAQQRLCRSTEPETGSTLFGYDAAGRLVWSAEGQTMGSGCASAPASRTTRYYDNMNRLTAVHHPDGKGNISTDYDAMGRITRATSTTASGPIRWDYGYDSNGHLTGETLAVDTHTWVLAYAYDNNGALKQVTYPNKQSVAYAPDALGRPTKVGGYVSDISHYPNGGLKRVVYGNGTVYQTTRNTRQLVSGLSYTHGGSRQINRTYSYDKNANLVHVNDLAGASDKSFTYDALNRLTAAQAAGLWGNASYVYDALNNLRRLSSDGQVRDYDYVNNRLVAIRRGGTQLHDFRYDAYGNAIGKDSQNRIFDATHRLRSIPGQASYRYDAAGRRVKATGNQTVYSAYSRGGQLMMQDNVSTGTMTNYIYLGKKQIAQVAGSTTNYVYTNLQGSPLAKANRWGTITARYSYRPYGLQQSGPVNHGPGYTGHVNDPATGLVYMQQRYYDPTIDRFISPDPIGPAAGNVFNFGRYTYANNNPVRFVDPTGAYTCVDNSGVDNNHYCSEIAKAYGALKTAMGDTSLSAGDHARIVRIVNSLGKPGKGNGVKIYTSASNEYFGNPTVGASAAFVGSKLTRTSVAIHIPMRKKFHGTTLALRVKGGYENLVVKFLGSTLLHEGSHMVDEMAAISNPSNMTEELVTEYRAYSIEAAYNRFMFHMSNARPDAFGPISVMQLTIESTEQWMGNRR